MIFMKTKAEDTMIVIIFKHNPIHICMQGHLLLPNLKGQRREHNFLR